MILRCFHCDKHDPKPDEFICYKLKDEVRYAWDEKSNLSSGKKLTQSAQHIAQIHDRFFDCDKQN